MPQHNHLLCFRAALTRPPRVRLWERPRPLPAVVLTDPEGTTQPTPHAPLLPIERGQWLRYPRPHRFASYGAPASEYSSAARLRRHIISVVHIYICTPPATRLFCGLFRGQRGQPQSRRSGRNDAVNVAVLREAEVLHQRIFRVQPDVFNRYLFRAGMCTHTPKQQQ